MLVLSRKAGERIIIGSNIAVTVIECTASRVRVGIAAPPEIPVHRMEVFERVQTESVHLQRGAP